MVAARADLSESTAQVAAAVAALASTQATLQAAQDREAAANAVVMQAQERYDEAAMEAGRAQTVLVMVQRASDGAQRDVSDAADQAGRTAREAYVQGPLSGVAALFESGSVTDLQDRMAALDSVGRSQRSRTASLQATAAGYSDRAGALSTQRDALAVQRDRVEARIQDLNGAEAAAHASSALLLTAVKAHELSLATAQTAADDDERRYQEMTAESVSVTTGIGSLPQLIPTTTPAGAHLQIPAQGPVTSPFGYRVHPITGVYKLHTGTDFGVPCGTPVHAAADGAVLSTTLTTAYGNRLVMVHPALGIATTYNHLTSFLVPPGTAVHQGDVIALSGTTGYSTGCHLHFEVVAYGGYVDPAPWLGLP